MSTYASELAAKDFGSVLVGRPILVGTVRCKVVSFTPPSEDTPLTVYFVTVSAANDLEGNTHEPGLEPFPYTINMDVSEKRPQTMIERQIASLLRSLAGYTPRDRVSPGELTLDADKWIGKVVDVIFEASPSRNDPSRIYQGYKNTFAVKP